MDIDQLCHTIGPAAQDCQALRRPQCVSHCTDPCLLTLSDHTVLTQQIRPARNVTRALQPGQRYRCLPAGMVYVAGNVPFVGCINVVVLVQGKEIQPQPLL